MSAINRGTVRIEQDLYPTPIQSFTPLLRYLPKDKLIWEPACGDRRLVRAMKAYGLKSEGNDLADGYDFLLDTTPREAICTNPPFSLSQEFIDHGLRLSSELFLLLRLNFLGTVGRRDWWIDHEPDALFIVTPRPSFVNGGTDATEYAWFYWGERYKGIIHLVGDQVNLGLIEDCGTKGQ